MQADPNASGMVLLDRDLRHGQEFAASISLFDLLKRSSDSSNLYEYLGSHPLTENDPLGLSWGVEDSLEFAAGAADPAGVIGAMYESLFTDYAANLEADVDWAMDWSLDDELHSRMDSQWVALSLIRGAGAHFGLGADEEEFEDLEQEEPDSQRIMAGKFTNGGVPWIGKVKRTISKAAYKRAAATYRAKKWQMWDQEVKDNPSK